MILKLYKNYIRFIFRFTKFLKKFSTSLPRQVSATLRLIQSYAIAQPQVRDATCFWTVLRFRDRAKTKWETFRFWVTCRKSEVSAVYIYNIYIPAFSDSWDSCETRGFQLVHSVSLRFASASWLRSAAVPAGAAPRCSAPQAKRGRSMAGVPSPLFGTCRPVGYTELHFLYICIYLKHFKTCFLLFCFSSFLVCLKNISKRSWYPHKNWHMPDTCRWYIFVTRGGWIAMTRTKRSVLTIPYWHDTVEWMDWRCVAYAGA